MKLTYWIAPAFLLTASLAGAATIISAVNNTVPNSMELNLPGSAVTAAGVITWTQTSTFFNVSVSAYLFSNNPTGGPPEQFTAYLTNSIGPATTAANNLASPITGIGSTSAAPAPGPATLLFSGLTLVPGTYYLTIQSLDTSVGGFFWESQAGLSPTFGSGVTGGQFFLAKSDGSTGSLNPTFAPASTLPLTNIGGSVFYTVTGDTTAPEPGSMVLLGLGLVALGAIRRRR